MASKAFSRLSCSLDECGVGSLQIERPPYNAMDKAMWSEIPQALAWLESQGARAVVVSALGKHFCSGIDLDSLSRQFAALSAGGCAGRRAFHLRAFILELQEAVSALERCRMPVIAAVHGACVGAGVDLITACDMRMCCSGATFCVKEADLSIVADMGTLQRLPGIVGQGIARELALTARTFDAAEAHSMHLVTSVHRDRDALLCAARETAAAIACKSPLAIAGVKQVMVYQRDHSVQDGLDYVATWNAGMLQSDDMEEALAARVQKRKPTFSKL